MTNFSNALAKGLAQAAKQAAEYVTYRRGTAAARISGMRGSKQVDNADTAQNSSVQVIRHDWIFEAPQLKLPTGTIQPVEGDEIVDALGTVYRVTKDPADGKCSRIMPHNVGIRIYTLIVAGEK